MVEKRKKSIAFGDGVENIGKFSMHFNEFYETTEKQNFLIS